MPDVLAEPVVEALAAVMAELADRGEVRHDIDTGALARFVLHHVHAPPSIPDDVWAALVRSSLTGTAAPSTRPSRRGSSAD